MGLGEAELLKLCVDENEDESDTETERLFVLVGEAVAVTEAVADSEADIDGVGLAAALGESDSVVEVVEDPVKEPAVDADAEGDMLLLPDGDKLAVLELVADTVGPAEIVLLKLDVTENVMVDVSDPE